MITVLVLAAVTAVIASGFLFRSANEAKLATRSHYLAVALNLAEGALEEALYSVNSNHLDSAHGWTAATDGPNGYTKSITTGFNFPQATGAIYMRVDNAGGASPSVTAAGVVRFPSQPPIVKQIRVRSSGGAKIFSNSLVAKGNITFSGTTDIDSYDSALGAYNTATNRSDRASVATTSTVQITDSAYIYGYVTTGGVAPSVGGTGRIYGATSPGTPLVDPSRVRTDFNTNLIDATAPTTSAYSLGAASASGSGVYALPRLGDLPGANGRYLYTCTSINVSGSAYISIRGPVDVICTGNTTVTDSAYIAVGGTGAVNPSLNFYSPGNLNLGGSAMINYTAVPSNLAVWGTKPSGSTQTITISGTAAFNGTMYAPNANIAMSNTGGLYGAIIANTLTLSGDTAVHYDVQLAKIVPTGGPTPGSGASVGYLHVSGWSELTKPPGSGAAFARDNRAPFAGLF